MTPQVFKSVVVPTFLRNLWLLQSKALQKAQNSLDFRSFPQIYKAMLLKVIVFIFRILKMS